jgi:PAS domain S-box-containing protein
MAASFHSNGNRFCRWVQPVTDSSKTQIGSSAKAARLVWLVVLLGALMCLCMLSVVSVVLTNLHEQRGRIAATETSGDRLMDAMGQSFADAQSEVNLILALRPLPASERDWALNMSTALDQFSKSDNSGGTLSTAALRSVIEPMTALRSAAVQWERDVRTNAAAIVELKKQADAHLTAMRAAVTSEEGRQRLQIAKLVRRFRAEGTADGSDLAKQIIATIGPSDHLTETTVEMDNLALLCEQLIGEADADRLTDIKDNQFCAALIRLRAAIDRGQSISPALRTALSTSLDRFDTSLFGNDCRVDSDQHLIRTGTDGLYMRCLGRLQLQHQKDDFRATLSQQADLFKSKFAQLERSYSAWRDDMTMAVEKKLRHGWMAMLVVSILGSAILLAMGNRIARTIRRQIVRIESVTTDLERTNAQTAAIHRTSLDGVLILDENWNTLDLNRAAEAAFGGTKADLVARRLDRLIGPHLTTANDPVAAMLRASGSAMTREIRAAVLGRRLEVIGKRGDGTTFPAEIAVTAAVVVGAPLFVASIRDISEQKHAETQREELHDRLLIASRQAGMAEVATGVLHNVGNILNSVNVSAGVIAEKMRKSEVASLKKAVGMLRDHLADLPAFLSADPRGRHLPSFLIEVAGCLEDEQRAVLPELEVVSRGLEHIKHIIAGQQSHAKGGIVLQPIKPADLINTALEIHRESFARHQVRVECRLEELAELPIDKHKVLQILVNLIANAKNAVCEGRLTERAIALVLYMSRRLQSGEPTLIFRIEDNGMGIAPENLARIFAHGFTTRKEGHGFGLHSAANAAKEMGGTLQVESDGVGKGAIFILEIPIQDGSQVKPTEPLLREAA